MGEELPAEVREIVTQRLRNIEEVDVLILLAAKPNEGLTIKEIRERLRLPESEAAPASILELQRNGLISSDPGDVTRYRYAPESPEVRKAVMLLAQAYHERPVTLVRLVYHRPGRAHFF